MLNKGNHALTEESLLSNQSKLGYLESEYSVSVLDQDNRFTRYLHPESKRRINNENYKEFLGKKTKAKSIVNSCEYSNTNNKENCFMNKAQYNYLLSNFRDELLEINKDTFLDEEENDCLKESLPIEIINNEDASNDTKQLFIIENLKEPKKKNTEGYINKKGIYKEEGDKEENVIEITEKETSPLEAFSINNETKSNQNKFIIEFNTNPNTYHLKNTDDYSKQDNFVLKKKKLSLSDSKMINNKTIINNSTEKFYNQNFLILFKNLFNYLKLENNKPCRLIESLLLGNKSDFFIKSSRKFYDYLKEKLDKLFTIENNFSINPSNDSQYYNDRSLFQYLLKNINDFHNYDISNSNIFHSIETLSEKFDLKNNSDFSNKEKGENDRSLLKSVFNRKTIYRSNRSAFSLRYKMKKKINKNKNHYFILDKNSKNDLINLHMKGPELELNEIIDNKNETVENLNFLKDYKRFDSKEVIDKRQGYVFDDMYKNCLLLEDIISNYSHKSNISISEVEDLEAFSEYTSNDTFYDSSDNEKFTEEDFCISNQNWRKLKKECNFINFYYNIRNNNLNKNKNLYKSKERIENRKLYSNDLSTTFTSRKIPSINNKMYFSTSKEKNLEINSNLEKKRSLDLDEKNPIIIELSNEDSNKIPVTNINNKENVCLFKKNINKSREDQIKLDFPIKDLTFIDFYYENSKSIIDNEYFQKKKNINLPIKEIKLIKPIQSINPINDLEYKNSPTNLKHFNNQGHSRKKFNSDKKSFMEISKENIEFQIDIENEIEFPNNFSPMKKLFLNPYKFDNQNNIENYPNFPNENLNEEVFEQENTNQLFNHSKINSSIKNPYPNNNIILSDDLLRDDFNKKADMETNCEDNSRLRKKEKKGENIIIDKSDLGFNNNNNILNLKENVDSSLNKKKEKLTYTNLIINKINYLKKKVKKRFDLKILQDNDILKSLIYIGNRKFSCKSLLLDKNLENSLSYIIENLSNVKVNNLNTSVNKKYKEEIEEHMNLYFDLSDIEQNRNINYDLLNNFLTNKSLEDNFKLLNFNNNFKNSLNLNKYFFQKNVNNSFRGKKKENLYTKQIQEEFLLDDILKYSKKEELNCLITNSKMDTNTNPLIKEIHSKENYEYETNNKKQLKLDFNKKNNQKNNINNKLYETNNQNTLEKNIRFFLHNIENLSVLTDDNNLFENNSPYLDLIKTVYSLYNINCEKGYNIYSRNFNYDNIIANSLKINNFINEIKTFAEKSRKYCTNKPKAKLKCIKSPNRTKEDTKNNELTKIKEANLFSFSEFIRNDKKNCLFDFQRKKLKDKKSGKNIDKEINTNKNNIKFPQNFSKLDYNSNINNIKDSYFIDICNEDNSTMNSRNKLENSRMIPEENKKTEIYSESEDNKIHVYKKKGNSFLTSRIKSNETSNKLNLINKANYNKNYNNITNKDNFIINFENDNEDYNYDNEIKDTFIFENTDEVQKNIEKRNENIKDIPFIKFSKLKKIRNSEHINSELNDNNNFNILNECSQSKNFSDSTKLEDESKSKMFINSKDEKDSEINIIEKYNNIIKIDTEILNKFQKIHKTKNLKQPYYDKNKTIKVRKNTKDNKFKKVKCDEYEEKMKKNGSNLSDNLDNFTVGNKETKLNFSSLDYNKSFSIEKNLNSKNKNFDSIKNTIQIPLRRFETNQNYLNFSFNTSDNKNKEIITGLSKKHHEVGIDNCNLLINPNIKINSNSNIGNSQTLFSNKIINNFNLKEETQKIVLNKEVENSKYFDFTNKDLQEKNELIKKTSENAIDKTPFDNFNFNNITSSVNLINSESLPHKEKDLISNKNIQLSISGLSANFSREIKNEKSENKLFSQISNSTQNQILSTEDIQENKFTSINPMNLNLNVHFNLSLNLNLNSKRDIKKHNQSEKEKIPKKKDNISQIINLSQTQNSISEIVGKGNNSDRNKTNNNSSNIFNNNNITNNFNISSPNDFFFFKNILTNKNYLIKENFSNTKINYSSDIGIKNNIVLEPENTHKLNLGNLKENEKKLLGLKRELDSYSNVDSLIKNQNLMNNIKFNKNENNNFLFDFSKKTKENNINNICNGESNRKLIDISNIRKIKNNILFSNNKNDTIEFHDKNLFYEESSNIENKKLNQKNKKLFANKNINNSINDYKQTSRINENTDETITDSNISYDGYEFENDRNNNNLKLN